MIRALIEAAQWLESGTNHHEAAAILAAPSYVGTGADIIEASLRGKYYYRAGDDVTDIPDYHVFHRNAANFPLISHGIWMLSQMCRWGQLPMRADLADIARAVYRPDLYREVAAELGLPVPPSDFKQEGLHQGPWTLEGVTLGADRFFDGRVFEPAHPLTYLEGFSVHSIQTEKSLAVS